MGVQSIVLKNRSLTNAVMSRMPPDTHTKRGDKYALNVLEAAIRRTKAYPAYLKANGVQHRHSPR